MGGRGGGGRKRRASGGGEVKTQAVTDIDMILLHFAHETKHRGTFTVQCKLYVYLKLELGFKIESRALNLKLRSTEIFQ